MSIPSIGSSHHTACLSAPPTPPQPGSPAQSAPDIETTAMAATAAMAAMSASAGADVVTDILSQLTTTDVSQLGQLLINGPDSGRPRPPAAATA
ncbi:hypothetical protein [Bordetella genomosp. 9]|uniref:hypothetical protein n=1 Tax=Bordetella genomosp. 9 TaxID=1416803 RepID=UPI0011784C4A|nr:hypothetical protein [Bordetella genomosp. 9]